LVWEELGSIEEVWIRGENFFVFLPENKPPVYSIRMYHSPSLQGMEWERCG
jgi:hypothetical protein